MVSLTDGWSRNMPLSEALVFDSQVDAEAPYGATRGSRNIQLNPDHLETAEPIGSVVKLTFPTGQVFFMRLTDWNALPK